MKAMTEIQVANRALQLPAEAKVLALELVQGPASRLDSVQDGLSVADQP